MYSIDRLNDLGFCIDDIQEWIEISVKDGGSKLALRTLNDMKSIIKEVTNLISDKEKLK
jgi:hypothetical protein